MKKIISVAFLFCMIWFNACGVFDSSDKPSGLQYQFKTNQTEVAADDTLKATFKNQSTQKIYLHYQICSVTELQTLQHDRWKSIPLPVFCTAEVRSPIQLNVGKSIPIRIPLSFFQKNQLRVGLYRLAVSASRDDIDHQVELTSNQFQITK